LGVTAACEESSELGIDLIDSTPEIYFTDTVTVKLSTVIIDSLPTNGLSRQLVGIYNDVALGEWKSYSYFQLGLSGSWAPQDDHIYDSLRLVLHYDEYSYGDTLQQQTLEVYRVAQTFEPDEGSRFYNTSSLKVYPESLASLTYTPRPRQQDSLIIKIDDQLGLEFFELAQNQDQRITEFDDFTDYFKGISLQARDAQNVIGFAATPELCYLELYYHQEGEEIEELSYRFPLSSFEQQFNAFKGDREQTALANLDNQRDQLAAEQSQQVSFLQGTSGVMTRVEFPHIQNIAKTSGFQILSAHLELVPVNETLDYEYPYPQQVIMARSDDFNTVGSLITVDYGSEAQISTLERDLEFATARYRFSLTEYIDLHLYQEDQGSGLLLALPTEDFPRSAHRLKINGLETKLLINYLITQ